MAASSVAPNAAPSVDPSVISSALLGQESNANPNSPTSIDGAVGQAQITPATWAQYAKPGEKIDNPDDNLTVHNRIVDDLSQRYDGDPARVAVGYFSGPGNVAPATSPTPWKHDRQDGNGKTVSSYVSDVMGRIGSAVVPSAQAAEANGQPTASTALSADPSQMSDEELMTEMDRNGLMPQASDYKPPDLGYIGNIPSITVRPQGVPVQPGANMPDPSQMSDEELSSAMAKEGMTVPPNPVPPKNTQTANQNLPANQVDPDEELRANARNEVNTSPLAALGAYGLNVLQVPTFGFGDEAVSGALAAIPNDNLGNSYLERYNNLQKYQQAYREAGENQEGTRIQTPSWMPDITATGLGQFATGLATAKMLPGLSAKPTGLVNAGWQGGKAGAKYGTLYGLGQGDAFQSDPVANAAIRLQNGAIGAGTGFAGGASLGAAGHLLSGSGSKVGELYDRLTGNPPPPGAAGSTTSNASVGGTTAAPQIPDFTQAQQRGHMIVGDALSTVMDKPETELVPAINSWADTLENTQRQTGLPLRAIDVATNDVGGVPVMGKDLQGLMIASARMPGKGAQLAGNMAARSAELPQHVSQIFDDLVSKNKFYDVGDQAMAEGKVSSPLYKEAFKQNQSMSSPLIDHILETPAGKQALSGAVEQMQDEMRRVAVPDKELTEQARDAGLRAQGGVASGLKMETLDYVKKELDAMARAAYKRAQNGSGTAAEANRYASLAADLRNEMDRLDVTSKAGPNSVKPEGGLYAQARAKSATKLQMQDALKNGRNILNMDPEEVERFMNDENTSDPQKLAFAAGARRAIADRFRNNPGQVSRLWNDVIRPRIEPLAPNAAAMSEADAKIDMLKRMQQNNNLASVSGNSVTMPAQQYAGLIEKPPSNVAKVVGAVFHPKDAAQKMALDLMDKATQKSAKNMTSDTAGEIQRILTTDNPQDLRDLAASIQSQKEPQSSILGK